MLIYIIQTIKNTIFMNITAVSIIKTSLRNKCDMQFKTGSGSKCNGWFKQYFIGLRLIRVHIW